MGKWRLCRQTSALRRYTMKKNFFKSIGMFLKALPDVLIFELIYKLMLVAIGAPLLTLLLKYTMKVSHVRYLSDEKVWFYLKNPANYRRDTGYTVLCSGILIYGASRSRRLLFLLCKGRAAFGHRYVPRGPFRLPQGFPRKGIISFIRIWSMFLLRSLL